MVTLSCEDCEVPDTHEMSKQLLSVTSLTENEKRLEMCQISSEGLGSRSFSRNIKIIDPKCPWRSFAARNGGFFFQNQAEFSACPNVATRSEEHKDWQKLLRCPTFPLYWTESRRSEVRDLRGRSWHRVGHQVSDQRWRNPPLIIWLSKHLVPG